MHGVTINIKADVTSMEVKTNMNDYGDVVVIATSW
jgi:hypothetical protein